jgi:hypothetical protein
MRSSFKDVQILLYPLNLFINQFWVDAFLVPYHNLSSSHLVLPIFKPSDLTKQRILIIFMDPKISLIQI